MGKWSGGIKRLESFGHMTLVEWLKPRRPYVAVVRMPKGMYEARLYDGAEYTGYCVKKSDLDELCKDIERYTMGLAKEHPGAEDPENVVWIYM